MKIKFLGLALFSFIIIASSCSKETNEKIEETVGPLFTVNIAGNDGESYKSTTGYGKMEGNHFVITSDKGDKEIFLYIKKFEKGKYTFDDSLNYATFSFDKSDASKIYKSEISKDAYIEIKYIHSDGKTFDGKFSFTCFDSNQDSQTISGEWINLVIKL